MNKKLFGIILLVVFALSLCSLTIAADILPAPTTMKLTVQQSPLAVYPPIFIYTAQLSYMPPVNTILTAEFYHVPANVPVYAPIPLGKATFDRTGKAVLSKQIKTPGTFIANAVTVIGGNRITSNLVTYRVP